ETLIIFASKAITDTVDMVGQLSGSRKIRRRRHRRIASARIRRQGWLCNLQSIAGYVERGRPCYPSCHALDGRKGSLRSSRMRCRLRDNRCLWWRRRERPGLRFRCWSLPTLRAGDGGDDYSAALIE